LAPALACSPASAIESHFTEIANGRWIEVRGGGSVSAPDFAELRLGVTTTARTAHEAMTANANAANALVSLIKSEGVAPADLQTLTISISPLFLAAIAHSDATADDHWLYRHGRLNCPRHSAPRRASRQDDRRRRQHY
jgi:hypothetical protein